MAGHAAVPNLEKRRRIGEKLFPSVKQHVAQPPAQHDPKNGSEGDKIPHFFFFQHANAASGKTDQQGVGADEAQDVGQALPVDFYRVGNFDQDGV